jgi:hypothetical protein
MLGYRGPAQPSPTLGDALNAGYLYLEAGSVASARSNGRQVPPFQLSPGHHIEGGSLADIFVVRRSCAILRGKLTLPRPLPTRGNLP